MTGIFLYFLLTAFDIVVGSLDLIVLKEDKFSR